MPSIMLPTVDCVDESTKSLSLLPATGHSPTTMEECQAVNSIFTRFPAKPDLPGEDLVLRWQCGQQQQQQRRGQTEGEGDEDGVCDLNRCSSPRAPPSSADTDGQERERISMVEKSSASLEPLLLLSSNEIPIAVAAKTNGLLTTSTAADVVFLDRAQISLVTLIRQLSHVTRHADTIFQRVTTDIDKISEHGQRLKLRLEVLRSHADSLLGKKAGKTNTSAGLVRYTNVKKHFRSVVDYGHEDKDERCRLFTPTTRSLGIALLYEEADIDPSKKRIRSANAPAVEHCATQTDNIRSSNTTQETLAGAALTFVPAMGDQDSKPVLRQSSMTNSFRQGPASAVDSGLHRCSEQPGLSTGGQVANAINATTAKIDLVASETSASSRSSRPKCANGGDEAMNCHATPSPQFGITPVSNCALIPAAVIAVDTSGAAFRRTAKLRQSGQYGEIVKRSPPDQNGLAQKEAEKQQRRTRPLRQKRSDRRNTVVGYEIDFDQRERMPNRNHSELTDYDIDSRKPKRDFSSSIIGTTGDSIANEVVYEFAPFYRRKSRRLLATANFFSSLRRPKKDKRISTSPAAYSTPIRDSTDKDDSVDYSSPYRSTKNEMSSSVHSDSAAMSPDGGASEENAGGKRSGTGSAIKGLKQLFQRSASLRRSKKDKGQSPNATIPTYSRGPPPPIPPRISVPAGGERQSADEDDPENRSTSSSLGFQRNYAWRPKTNLPISTTSQVIHVATQMRDCPRSLMATGSGNDQRLSKLSSSSSRDSAYSSCGKKLRPPSVVSLVSLDFTESKVNGWYRQGYQLEYPDECTREDLQPPAVPVENALPVSSTPAKTPTIDKVRGKLVPQTAASRDTSNSSPHSDVSSFVDSNFSCDREGYFTTMHRDCGLSRRVHGQHGGLSTEERKVLIVAPSVHDATGDSGSSLDTVTEPLASNGGRGRTIAPAAVGDQRRPGIKQRPPDLSLPASIPMTRPVVSPAPASAASDAEIKFDLWLMSKFHAEQRLQQFRRQQQQGAEVVANCGSPRQDNSGFFSRSFGRFSLPRSRKDSNQQKMKNGYVVEYLKSLGYGGTELRHKQQAMRTPINCDYSCTMPRKTVRFCE